MNEFYDPLLVERRLRSEAMERAVAWTCGNNALGVHSIVEAAEKIYTFLSAGEALRPAAMDGLGDFRRWLQSCQLPPHAGTDYIDWLDPKLVLERFERAMAERAAP